MRIHCDVCGLEIMKEDAIAIEENGEVFYFCSDACVEKKDFHETMQDPNRAENADDIR